MFCAVLCHGCSCNLSYCYICMWLYCALPNRMFFFMHIYFFYFLAWLFSWKCCIPATNISKKKKVLETTKQTFPLRFNVVTLLRGQVGASYLAGTVCNFIENCFIHGLFDVSNSNYPAILCLSDSMEKKLLVFSMVIFHWCHPALARLNMTGLWRSQTQAECGGNPLTWNVRWTKIIPFCLVLLISAFSLKTCLKVVKYLNRRR